MLSFNWIDYVILVVLLIYAYEGFSNGFIRSFFSLTAFVLSFLLGLRFYKVVATILVEKASLPQGFSSAIGFFVIAAFSQLLIGLLFLKLSAFRPRNLKWPNRILGIFPSVLSGLILISFVLILVATLPLPSLARNTILSSKISSFLLSNAQGWEKQIDNVFGGVINETISFLTIEPKSNEMMSLNFKATDILPDITAEQDMFNMVNKEREERGIRKLSFDTELRDVGRRHCADMLKRGYFSHYTPEGISPFDRMDTAGVIYIYAGENIALAPTTDIAMQGLMDSPGHKANILSTDFGRVGIGVIDGGIYGEMFCQEFRD